MAARTFSPLEEHAGKIFLAIVIVIAAAIAWYFIFGQSVASNVGGRPMTAGQIREELERAGEDLAAKIQDNAKLDLTVVDKAEAVQFDPGRLSQLASEPFNAPMGHVPTLVEAAAPPMNIEADLSVLEAPGKPVANPGQARNKEGTYRYCAVYARIPYVGARKLRDHLRQQIEKSGASKPVDVPLVLEIQLRRQLLSETNYQPIDDKLIDVSPYKGSPGTSVWRTKLVFSGTNDTKKLMDWVAATTGPLPPPRMSLKDFVANSQYRLIRPLNLDGTTPDVTGLKQDDMPWQQMRDALGSGLDLQSPSSGGFDFGPRPAGSSSGGGGAGQGIDFETGVGSVSPAPAPGPVPGTPGSAARRPAPAPLPVPVPGGARAAAPGTARPPVPGGAAQQRGKAAKVAGGTYVEMGELPDPNRDLWIGAYAIDDTIETNKTYRYQFRYVLLNPLLNQDVLKDAQNRQIGFESPWSEWSGPVKTDRDLYFFLARSTSTGGEPTIDVDVFRNVQSLWFRDQYTITRGVPVGVLKENFKSNKSGDATPRTVDFRTGVVPLDIRSSKEIVIHPTLPDGTPSLDMLSTPQVVFVDARGQLLTRTVKQDALNEDYIRIMKAYTDQGRRTEPAAPPRVGVRGSAVPARAPAPGPANALPSQ